MMQWLRSLLGRDTSADIRSEIKIAQAASDAVYKMVNSQFEMADVAPVELRKDAIEFTCGYIAGFSDVMAQACGSQGGQSLSITICIRTMQHLYGNEVGEAMFSATTKGMHTQSQLFKGGMNAGGEDANSFLRKGWTGNLADYLLKHSAKE
ncbi:MAG: hypothetical protein WEE89_07700 [Gemmatimonadota bacterium]